MAVILEELERQALRLSTAERELLIHRLIVSLEGEPEDTPEAIAQAWDEEITRRVAHGMDTCRRCDGAAPRKDQCRQRGPRLLVRARIRHPVIADSLGPSSPSLGSVLPRVAGGDRWKFPRNRRPQRTAFRAV